MRDDDERTREDSATQPMDSWKAESRNLAHQLNRIDIKGHFWRAYMLKIQNLRLV